MGAPVASGTLAGSTSGSWASIHKEAARGDFSRFRRHPRVVRLAHLCRPSRSRTSSSGTTPQPSEKQQSEIGVAGGARFVRRGGATPRARGRLSAAAGCGEHTVRWSPTVTATAVDATIGTVAYAIVRRGRQRIAALSPLRSRRGHASWRFLSRKALVQSRRSSRLPLGDRDSAATLLHRRFRASTITCCVGTDGIDGRRDLDHRAVAWPGGAVISSLPAHARPQLVLGGSEARDEHDASSLEIAEEPLLATIAQISAAGKRASPAARPVEAEVVGLDTLAA